MQLGVLIDVVRDAHDAVFAGGVMGQERLVGEGAHGRLLPGAASEQHVTTHVDATRGTRADALLRNQCLVALVVRMLPQTPWRAVEANRPESRLVAVTKESGRKSAR